MAGCPPTPVPLRPPRAQDSPQSGHIGHLPGSSILLYADCISDAGPYNDMPLFLLLSNLDHSHTSQNHTQNCPEAPKTDSSRHRSFLLFRKSLPRRNPPTGNRPMRDLRSRQRIRFRRPDSGHGRPLPMRRCRLPGSRRAFWYWSAHTRWNQNRSIPNIRHCRCRSTAIRSSYSFHHRSDTICRPRRSSSFRQTPLCSWPPSAS